MTMTPTRRPTKSGAVGGERARPRRHVFLSTIEPAMASDGDDHEEAADEHREPSVTFHQGVLAFSPANAEPLLPAPLVYA